MPRRLTALVCLLPLAAVAALARAEPSRFACQVTGTESLERLAPEGGAAELSRFTCRVRGGPLDGYVATGTNIWSGPQRDGLLLGSMVVARRGESVVVYEVTQVTRDARRPRVERDSWEGRGTGVYKLATGSAAALAGKSFRSVARSVAPGAFTIDTRVDD